MYKKLALISIFIICFVNLSGCNNLNNTKIKITVNDKNISYYEISENTNIYQFALEQNPSIENLFQVYNEDTVIIDFDKN